MNTKKASHLFLNIVVISCALIVLIISFFFFGNSIQRMIDSQAFSLLSSESRIRVKIIQTRFDEQYYILESAAELASSSVDDRSELLSKMNALVASGDFSKVVFFNTAGEGFDNNGNDTPPDEYHTAISKSMNGNRSIYYIKTAQDYYSSSTLYLSVPVYRNNMVIGTIVGCHGYEFLETMLTAYGFDDTEYGFICDNSGVVIARGNSKISYLYSNAHSNAVEMAEMVNFNDITLEEITDDARLGKISTFTYYYNNQKAVRYGTFMPLGVGNWYIFSGIPASSISDSNDFLPTHLWNNIVLLIGVFCLLTVYILLSEHRQRKAIEKEKELLLRSEERFMLLDELTGSILFEGNFETGDVTINTNYLLMFGRKPPKLNLVQISDSGDVLSNIHPNDLGVFNDFVGKIISEKRTAKTDFRILDSKGNYIWTRAEYFLQYGANNKPYGFLGQLSNITEEKNAISSLEKMADLDPLTGVNNVSSTKKLVGDILSVSHKDNLHAMLFMDIDNFKSVNDTFGHAEGDRVIIELSHELRHMYPTDVVGRVGGDEFVVFIRDVVSEDYLRMRVDNMRKAINKKLSNSFGTNLTCSIGVSLYNRDGKNYEVLSQKADDALYKAKAAGKNRYVIYDTEDGKIQ